MSYVQERLKKCYACSHSECMNGACVVKEKCSLTGENIILKTKQSLQSCPINKWSMMIENSCGCGKK